MQQTNYNETNGIIVGPEISRIFAEIIFQRIDVNVLNRLKQKNASLKLGRDYEVRRYVDDHYIYANSEENLLAILEIYKEELQYYKLFINESKLDFSSRPFVSDVSDAKHDINKLVSTIAEKWLEKDNDNNYKYVVKNEIKIFTSVVNEFRSLTYRHNQKYGNINRYILSLLASQIGNELNRKHIPEPSLGLLIMYAEIGFYVFSLDMNASASIKICRILEHLHRWAEHCKDKTILTELESRIYREVKRCLDIYEVKYEDGETNIEVLNLLLCMSRLMKNPIPTSQLEKVFKISNNKVEDFKQLNYFQICTLLYIIGNDACYDNIRKRIAAEICRRLTEENSMYHSDNAMLFFDAMVCPYVHFQKEQIGQIIQKVYKCPYSAYGNKYIELTKTKRWFFNWDKTYPLSEALSKKEYHSPYE